MDKFPFYTPPTKSALKKPAFTTRHFKAIADVLAGSWITDRDDCVRALATLFSNDNPNFDPAKFLKACEQKES